MKPNTWTEKELTFLRTNYPKKGVSYCAKTLGYTESKISNMTCKLKLKLTKDMNSKRHSKHPEKCNINPNLFTPINKKEVAYLLGLIWADGYLNPSKNGYNHNFGFTMINEDVEAIRPVLNSIGKWNYYERKQPVKTWIPSVNVITNNKRILTFLIEHDYHKKSYLSADKILSKIPTNLQSYFFRGLVDGDGCFYTYKPKKGSTLRQFTLTSTYEQDWSYIEKLCNKLKIKHKINRVKTIKNSSSFIRITNKEGIKKLGVYLYDNFEVDRIGLKRKYDKFKLTQL